jgi:hypothetical protein
MWRRKRRSIRTLLLALLLVTGPVHAQTVVACAMMDTAMTDMAVTDTAMTDAAMTDMAMHGKCACCHHNHDKPCADSNSDCGCAVDSGDDPCCEHSVQLSIGEDVRQIADSAKPAAMRFEADQFPTIFFAFSFIEPPRAVAAHGVVQSLPTAGRSRSDTYLITQRLRI